MDKRGLGFVALVAAVLLALGAVWMAVGSTSTPAPRPTISPVVSAVPHDTPAGLRIAFSTDRDGDNEIYVMTIAGTDGGVPRLFRLTNHEADDEGATWAPDGMRLAFESDRDGNWEIYVTDVSLSGEIRLTRHPADDYFSAWSPPTGGRYIVFVSERKGRGDLYLLDVEQALQSEGTEGELIRLTKDSVHHDTQPDWSPDGQHIVFVSERDGNRELYILDVQDALQGAGDAALTRLTDNPARDHFPAWSPDGTRIAFASARDSDEDEIYVMNVDHAVPHATPDGRGGRGTDPIRLTDNQFTDSFPTWSPDGTRIAFHSNRDGNWEVYVMNADGSGQTNVTNHPANDGFPVWAPE